MSLLDTLYQQAILEHYKNPRNHGALDPHDVKEEGLNPSCGDELTLYLRLNGDVLEKVTFEGEGCAISQATASMMTQVVNGRPVSEVLDIAEGRVEAKLVDIRSNDEYTGKIFAPEGVKELSVRAGHIPTAENVPWGSIVQEDGRFKPVDEIKAIYAEKGIDGSQPIVTYCRIGERSSHTWFALSRILGYDVKNYDGSWTEYGNAVGVPVVNVAGTVWTGK